MNRNTVITKVTNFATSEAEYGNFRVLVRTGKQSGKLFIQVEVFPSETKHFLKVLREYFKILSQDEKIQADLTPILTGKSLCINIDIISQATADSNYEKFERLSKMYDFPHNIVGLTVECMGGECVICDIIPSNKSFPFQLRNKQGKVFACNIDLVRSVLKDSYINRMYNLRCLLKTDE